MSRAMIVVAGGSGSRMGAEVPKQFLHLKGRPLLMHTLAHLHSMDTAMKLVLALPQEHIATWKSLSHKHHFSVAHIVVAGGPTRFRSVENALKAVGPYDLIGIHDGVRPFVAASVVRACFDAAQAFGAAVPVVEIVQSLRKVDGTESMAVNRADFKAVQTPQCFQSDILLHAFAVAAHDQYTDDAAVVEATGQRIALVEGNHENIKVTTPLDMRLAELLIN
jgi:2-C-methyl-D-erythritol 4-phosphate cytidylyltransferase